MSDDDASVTMHFRVTGPGLPPTTLEEDADSAERARALAAAVLAGEPSIVEEWRIIANVGAHFPTYDFTWRGPKAEGSAKAFLDNKGAWTDVRLLHRTVVSSAWEASE